MLFIVPADPLRPREPDPLAQPEYAAALALGVPVALIDHDAVVAGRYDEAYAGLAESADAVYRGWMVTSAAYQEMYDTLADQGVTLRTEPEAYQRAHELPSWWASVAEHTPDSVWTTGPDLDQLVAAAARFGSQPVMIKDFVKSLKHHWDEAVYVSDASDESELRQVASRYLELRGDQLVGGLVLRRWEALRPEQLRSWWLDGQPRFVSAHPDTPEVGPEGLPDLDHSLAAIAPAIAELGLRFATVDWHLDETGAWRLIEIGDGQVSERPITMQPATLLEALASES